MTHTPPQLSSPLCVCRRDVSSDKHKRPRYTGYKRTFEPHDTHTGDDHGGNAQEQPPPQQPLYARKVEHENDIPSAAAIDAALPSLKQLNEELLTASELQLAIEKNRTEDFTIEGYNVDDDDDDD